MGSVSRREFVAMAGATLAAGKLAVGQQAKLTAGEVVDRIKKNLGIPWNSTTFRDTWKIGDPSMPVSGIATSFGTNLTVMDKAAKAGLNMIIPHEPTFWSDADIVDLVKDDPVYKYKMDFAAKNHMSVWRIHDHAHAHKPDFIMVGWNQALGWEKYESDGMMRSWKLPPTTLQELAKYLAKTLPSGTRSIRVIGDPNLPVSTAVIGRNLTSLIQNYDAIICSDSREYECFEYSRDAVRAGVKRGYIYLSHEAFEDAGMQAFANWLQPLVPEVPVKFISTTDEFWNG
jgi:putative NIF3 family GTP cyclohydrolase 1 type 2